MVLPFVSSCFSRASWPCCPLHAILSHLMLSPSSRVILACAASVTPIRPKHPAVLLAETRIAGLHALLELAHGNPAAWTQLIETEPSTTSTPTTVTAPTTETTPTAVTPPTETAPTTETTPATETAPTETAPTTETTPTDTTIHAETHAPTTPGPSNAPTTYGPTGPTNAPTTSSPTLAPTMNHLSHMTQVKEAVARAFADDLIDVGDKKALEFVFNVTTQGMVNGLPDAIANAAVNAVMEEVINSRVLVESAIQANHGAQASTVHA